MRPATWLPLMLVTLFAFAAPDAANAQVLGTFRWNTAPYCNVMVLTVTRVGTIYRLEGYEEQCGNNPAQPIWGTGIVLESGMIMFGLDQVMTLGSVRPVALRAFLAPWDLSGTWSDSVGSEGAFRFNPPSVSGGPRPVPASDRAPVPPASDDSPREGGLDRR